MPIEETQKDNIIFRPATPADIPILADFLVQLYAAELPGALTGSPAQQSKVLQYTLEAQPEQALQNRFVLCNTNNQVIATGMIQFPTSPPFDRAPAGTISMAAKILGYQALGRLILTVARSRIAVYSELQTDTALLHSIVVDANQRGKGLGRILLTKLEKVITEQGLSWAALQVLEDNKAARHLYTSCGYQDIWHTPSWVTMLSWSSYVMRKELQ